MESGSKVFFWMFSCYMGIVLYETACWHSHNIEHFEITSFTFFHLSGHKIVVLRDREKQKITLYIHTTDSY